MKPAIFLLLLASVSLASAAEGKRRFTNKEWYDFGVNDGFLQLAENKCEPIYTSVQNEAVRKARIIIEIMYVKDDRIIDRQTDPKGDMMFEWMRGRGVADNFDRSLLRKQANLKEICSAAYGDAKEIMKDYKSDFDPDYRPTLMIHDPTYNKPTRIQ